MDANNQYAAAGETGLNQAQMDAQFMAEALEEARQAAAEGEVPIGALVVFEGAVIARAHNRRELDADPSAHAEFSAMVEAARVLGRWRLTGCTVYVTLEPCCMCAGLMVNARIDRCVYGAADPKGGALGSLYALNCDHRLNHAFAVTAGVCADACREELQQFFAHLRERERSLQDSADISGVSGTCAYASEDVCLGSSATGPHAALLSQDSMPAPRVLLAMDSFKGSATSAQVAAWAAEGVHRVCPQAQTTILAVADGGEGTLEAVCAALGGEMVACTVTGPLGDSVTAHYVRAERAGTSIAVIEMAQAAGLGYSPRTHSAALAATTYGVGELIRHACEHGAQACYLALGGSATNDGGAGMLQALGARLTNAAGEEVPRGLAGLEHLAAIDLAPAHEALKGATLTIFSDVDNPLVGARGALAVFGPQKGLAGSLERFDAWMIAYGRVLDAARERMVEAEAATSATDAVLAVSDEGMPAPTDASERAAVAVPAADGTAPTPRHRSKRAFRSVLGVPGAGAAGGMAAALLALGAQLVPGVEAVLDLVNFDGACFSSDVVITGEGHMDEQSAGGKTPVGVAHRAKYLHKPVIALVGGRAENLEGVYQEGVDLVLPVVRHPMTLEQALSESEAHANIACAGEAAIRAYLMGRMPH